MILVPLYKLVEALHLGVIKGIDVFLEHFCIVAVYIKVRTCWLLR
jgi:hypothetical protein